MAQGELKSAPRRPPPAMHNKRKPRKMKPSCWAVTEKVQDTSLAVQSEVGRTKSEVRSREQKVKKD